MPETLTLNRPWLVAVWPGMGHVAYNAGVYLLSNLHMDAFAELEAGDLFDADHVEVRGGILRAPRRPRTRFFAWRDPKGRRDLVVLLGEAQPPLGRLPFCRHVVSFAKQLGVERVVTFAAMATGMRPEDRSRLFVAATDKGTLGELQSLGPEVLEDGQIGGLNGVLLGVAAQEGLRGACLLGEMPQVFVQLPFPKASLSVLEAFAVWAGIDLDLTELERLAQTTGENLGELLARVEEVASGASPGAEGDESEYEEPDEPPEELPEQDEETRLGAADERRIEELFSRAAEDRSKAFELKRVLDRLGAFRDYEDRFLDLFRKSG